MPRPSRLGLALAATVAASSLFVGGGLASAAPGPDSQECKDATTALANETDATKKPDLETAKEAACKVTETSPTEETQSQSPVSPAPVLPVPGADGADGAPGKDGTPGKDGAPGKDGKPGEQGRQGERGERGRDGRDGVTQLIVVPVYLDGRSPRDIDCDDFPNQPAAQAYFDEDESDPARLDADNDDKACESLADLKGAKIAQVSDVDLDKTADDQSEVEGSQVSEVPEGSVDTGGFQ